MARKCKSSRIQQAWIAYLKIWCKRGCIGRRRRRKLEEEEETKTPLTLVSKDGKDLENTDEKSKGSCNQINVESQYQEERGSPSYAQDCMHP